MEGRSGGGIIVGSQIVAAQHGKVCTYSSANSCLLGLHCMALSCRCNFWSDTLDSSIATVEQQIRDVEASVMNAESEATRAKVADDAEERQVWLTEEQQLRTEEQQLRTEKQQLRDEKARKEALPQGMDSF